LSSEREGSSNPESASFNELHEAEPTSRVGDPKEMVVGQVSPQKEVVISSGGSERLENRTVEEESMVVRTPDSCEVSPCCPLKELEDPVSNSAGKFALGGSHDPPGAVEEEGTVCEAETVISNVMDDSDDSGPEEVPILKNTDSIGNGENGHDEDINETVQTGERARKRRRQSQQPPKTEDKNPTSGSQRQQQNKRYENINRPQRFHRPPFRGAPTLLEKVKYSSSFL